MPKCDLHCGLGGGFNNRVGWKFPGYLISRVVLSKGEWKIEKLYFYSKC